MLLRHRCINFRGTENVGPVAREGENMVWSLFSAAAVFILASCGASAPHSAVVPEAGVQSLREGNTRFAVDLYRMVCLESGADNVMLSPFCVSSALGMAWAGARGETEAEMAQVLGLRGEPEEVHAGFARLMGQILRENAERPEHPVTLNIANALWVERTYPLLDEYVETVRNSYRAEAGNLDFKGDPEGGRAEINQWAADRTEGLITDLLGPGAITPDTRAVLTSAVYFKGDWMYQFNPEATRPGHFTTLAGGTVEVPFMHRTGDYPFFAGEGFRALSLPYSDGRCRMVAILPDGDLQRFEQEFSVETLRRVDEGLAEKEVILAMPPFRFSTLYNLAGTLSSMGMPEAFDGATADFSGFSGSRDLFISEVVHKAYVKVDETGTEAAAATGVIMATTAMPENPPEYFVLDRPFMFLIMDDLSGTVLFMGRVADPSE